MDTSVKTLSNQSLKHWRQPFHCPKCQGRDLNLNLEQQSYVCQICGHQSSFLKHYSDVLPPRTYEKKEFSICLTHDIDSIGAPKMVTFARKIKHFFRLYANGNKHDIYSHIARRAQHSTLNPRKKRLIKPDTWDDLIRFEKDLGIRSTLFVFPEHVHIPHITDCLYRYSDQLHFRGHNITFAKFIQTVHQEGWEIGLHASWSAAYHADEMRFQKEQIENLIQAPIQSIRQHHLHFIPGLTEHIQLKSGFRFDSSIGFNHTIGFHREACIPWSLALDNASDQTLTEVPLIVHDNAVFHPLRLGMSFEEGVRTSMAMIDECKRVSGCATLLWHLYNPYFLNPLKSYQIIIRKCLQDYACPLGTMRDMGSLYLQKQTQN